MTLPTVKEVFEKIKKDVLKYFKENPGKYLTPEELAEKLMVSEVVVREACYQLERERKLKTRYFFNI